MIVSGTRIAFKHLPKQNFTETDLRNFVMQYSKKEGDNKPQKIKLISQVQILLDKSSQAKEGNGSMGIAFVQFVKEEQATYFLN